MGDVTNFIDYASTRPPNEVVTGECHWNNTDFDLSLSKFSDTVLYTSIPYTCTLTTSTTKILTMYFSLNMQVNLVNAFINLDYTLRPHRYKHHICRSSANDILSRRTISRHQQHNSRSLHPIYSRKSYGSSSIRKWLSNDRPQISGAQHQPLIHIVLRCFLKMMSVKIINVGFFNEILLQVERIEVLAHCYVRVAVCLPVNVFEPLRLFYLLEEVFRAKPLLWILSKDTSKEILESS
jgi:hypothetical protein